MALVDVGVEGRREQVRRKVLKEKQPLGRMVREWEKESWIAFHTVYTVARKGPTMTDSKRRRSRFVACHPHHRCIKVGGQDLPVREDRGSTCGVRMGRDGSLPRPDFGI